VVAKRRREGSSSSSSEKENESEDEEGEVERGEDQVGLVLRCEAKGRYAMWTRTGWRRAKEEGTEGRAEAGEG
jgi:hypothetical protein